METSKGVVPKIEDSWRSGTEPRFQRNVYKSSLEVILINLTTAVHFLSAEFNDLQLIKPTGLKRLTLSPQRLEIWKLSKI
jgi:hypothetical protein